MQNRLFSPEELPANYEELESLRALDELFVIARQFSTRSSYGELLQFIARFRMYSAYNSLLIHTQMPGAKYVATPKRWLQDYGRTILPGARPVAILQPKGPILFVFDVSDTSALPGTPPLPQSVTNPFAIFRGMEKGELDKTIENAKRDGVRVHERAFGSQQAGRIETTETADRFYLGGGHLFKQKKVAVPIRYELLLNSHQTREERYATLVHELAHLYCGHIGSPNEQYWPNRRELTLDVRECEAESISYLVCTRLGIETPAAEYVSNYLADDGKMPPISLDLVVKTANLIQQMGQSKLPLRKHGREAEIA